MSNNFSRHLIALLKQAIRSLKVVNIVKKVLSTFQSCVAWLIGLPNNSISVVSCAGGDEAQKQITVALQFYAHTVAGELITRRNGIPILRLFAGEGLLISDKLEGFSRLFLSLFKNVFFISQSDYAAGWEWIRFSNWYYNHKPDLLLSKSRLELAVKSAKLAESDRTYVFGTGPSLARAIDHSFNDGYRIVCNTIVRDKELFNKLRPNFIVAGDAVYHFSYTEFAAAFRRDLIDRLINSETYFVYPALFDVIVQREFKQITHQLIPIPIGALKKIENSLLVNFSLPNLGNVLPLLQLPMACTLSRKIYLWGFDGKSPGDNKNPFWANSEKHSYPELMHTLRAAFPGFFDHIVPLNDSSNYISRVHGDVLNECLRSAESDGYIFEMLHPSWTATLAMRYNGNLSPEEYFNGKQSVLPHD